MKFIYIDRYYLTVLVFGAMFFLKKFNFFGSSMLV